MKSAARSAIIMVVTLVLARTTSGITEASATRKPCTPRSRGNYNLLIFQREFLSWEEAL